MAWFGEVVSRSKTTLPTGVALVLRVRYYDDANSGTTLFVKEFTFDGDDLALATVAAAVRTAGAKEREAMTKVDAALTIPQLAVGQTLNIP